jgi:hypothetical protein
MPTRRVESRTAAMAAIAAASSAQKASEIREDRAFIINGPG